MSGRLWSRCLSVWMGKSQRILAWSFLTTFSGSTHQSLLCSISYSAHMALYIIEATLLCLWVYSVLGSLVQPAFWILHSVVDLVCHCDGVEGLLLSCHDQSLGVRSDIASIEPSMCAGYVCNFWHKFGQAPCRGFLYQAAALSGSFQRIRKVLE